MADRTYNVARLHAESLGAVPVSVDDWGALFETEQSEIVWPDAEALVEAMGYERVREFMAEYVSGDDAPLSLDDWATDEMGYSRADVADCVGGCWMDHVVDGYHEYIVDEVLRFIDDAEWYDGMIPVMSYYYPVGSPYLTGADQARLVAAGLPLSLVEIDGVGVVLVLTGGGMDLSWEICEAYMVLGQLPPVHFCDLPGMAGRGESARDRSIIAACLRSLAIVAERAIDTRGQLIQRYGATVGEMVAGRG